MIVRAAVLVVLASCIAFTSVAPATGAHFSTVLDQGDPEMALLIQGSIKQGDAARFQAALDNAAAQYTDHRMRAVALHSSGGSISEAAKMADIIRSRGLATVVPEGAGCGSACVLLFAAGSRKIMSIGATIAVHAAAEENGNETERALAATTLLARALVKLGAPSSVITRMMNTPPSRMMKITAEEVEMFPGGYARQEFLLEAVPYALSGLDDGLRLSGVPHVIPPHQKSGPVLPTPPPPSGRFSASPPHPEALVQRARDYSAGFAYGERTLDEAACNRATGNWRRGCLSGIGTRNKLDFCLRAKREVDPRAAVLERQYCREQGYYKSIAVEAAVHEWLDAYDEAYTTKTREGSCGNGSSPGNDGCRVGAQAWHGTEVRQ